MVLSSVASVSKLNYTRFLQCNYFNLPMQWRCFIMPLNQFSNCSTNLRHICSYYSNSTQVIVIKYFFLVVTNHICEWTLINHSAIRIISICNYNNNLYLFVAFSDVLSVNVHGPFNIYCFFARIQIISSIQCNMLRNTTPRDSVS